MKDLGIYVHIPFCKKKCDYCDFISFEHKSKLIKSYIEALNKEIKSSKINYNEYLVNTIYIGGGTPSYINCIYIEEIIKSLKQKFNISKTAEVTIEVNPGTVNKSKLKSYFETGINRISFGLQSTNNRLLDLIGRIHTYEEFLSSYNIAREIGFKNINVDLMIGLPTQTLENIEKDLNRILEISPEHVSVYSLILEEETKLEKKISSKELYLPNEKLERKMYWKVKNILEKNGFEHYEISNFARKGFKSRHNLACWEQAEYIGFGLAAHSYLNNVRYSNTMDFNEYFDCPENSKIVHERQNKEDKMKEFMLLGLRKIDGIKISEFKNRFIDNPIYLYRENLNKLVMQGLIEIEEDNIKLTNKGIDLANLVWEKFV